MNKPLLLLAAMLGAWMGPSGAAQPPTQPSPGDPGSAGRILVSQDREAARRLFESWRPPVPPVRIIGPVHYVGLRGVSSWLITTPEGHVLIDTAFEDSVPQICRNVEQLGFRVEDIRWILGSHAHADHVGGHAAMKRRTGARIAASAADAHVMETGGADDFSPFPKDLLAYAPVKADRIVKDGDTVSLGGVTLTAHLTPGHTKGATTWSMVVREGDFSRHVVFFSSVSLVAPTRLLGNPEYPAIVDDYRATFDKLRALPCDVVLAPHGDQFGLAAKIERLNAAEQPNPFIDPAGWRRMLDRAEALFRQQLETEQLSP